jgi:hypothetical protein
VGPQRVSFHAKGGALVIRGGPTLIFEWFSKVMGEEGRELGKGGVRYERGAPHVKGIGVWGQGISEVEV